MNIEQIRKFLKDKGKSRRSNKEIIADWLAHDCETRFDFGLTVMPKKVLYKHVPSSKGVKNNMLYRHLNKTELATALHELVEIFNDVIYKNAYRRYGKKLDVVMVIEGERSRKDLHGHFALAKPATMDVMEFKARVLQALEMSEAFLIADKDFDPLKGNYNEKYRYKLDAIDSDWLYYITKELDSKYLNNLYLP